MIRTETERKKEMKKKTSNIPSTTLRVNSRRTSKIECGSASRSYLVAGIQHRASSIQKRSNRIKDLPKTMKGAKPHTNLKSKVVRGKRIKLTWGKWAIVDAEDYGRLRRYKWLAVEQGRCWYAKTLKRDGMSLAMHRLIMDAPKHLMVDHIDHDGLNNRKSNLRLCTRKQNRRNSRPRPGSSSKYKGVCRCKGRNKFRAEITHHYKRIYLGRFKNEIDAAKAYDKAAIKLFGEFAYLNFPEEANRK